MVAGGSSCWSVVRPGERKSDRGFVGMGISVVVMKGCMVEERSGGMKMTMRSVMCSWGCWVRLGFALR